MATLQSFINGAAGKVRIGMNNLSGYDISSFMQKEQVQVLKEEERTKKRIGGVAGVSDISGMDMEIDASTNIIRGDYKQIKLDVSCGFAIPMQSEDGKDTFMAASTVFQKDTGMILTGAKSFPSFLQQNYVSAIDDGPIKAGIALDLDDWGTAYMAEHFPDSDMQGADLVALAKKGLLCAEVVVHSNTELSSSGKAFYANVVDIAAGHKKVCYISPYFSFGDYKDLGMDYPLSEENEVTTLQTTKLKCLVTGSYDYKTGNLSFDKNSLQSAALNSNGLQLKISGQVTKCCRVRLFVSDLQQAKEVLNKAKIEDAFQETNGKVGYTGGITVKSGNRTAPDDVAGRIAFYGKVCQEVLSASCCLYSQSHQGIAPLEKANTTELLKEHARANNLKYAPVGIVKLIAEHADSRLKQTPMFPTCDCSLFVTWVLMEAGVLKSGVSAAQYTAGHFALNDGYEK